MKKLINKNLKFINQCYSEQEYNKEGDLIKGKRGVVLEGSSRSGKTISAIDFIIKECVRAEKPLIINIVKETYNEFKTTLYNDFEKRLTDFSLPNPFENAKEVSSFKIYGSKITFLGADKPSKFHGAQCDLLYINEALNVSQKIFDQAEMRCKKFWILDYNPSVTEHWIFNAVIPRNDVGYIHSTYKDNPFISIAERNKILSYEPTESNITQGTSDDFMWKVYGLGKRGAMKGLIFKHVEYIDKFPELATTYGLDFGFTSDPTALVKYAQEGNNIYLELLSYEPIEQEAVIVSYFEKLGIEKLTPMTADSSDRYISEKRGVVEMVKGIRNAGYSCTKVSKTKSVMYWLLKMKTYKVHIVRNNFYKFAKKEVENYRLKEVNGIAINQPEDKFNHFWDASRYAFMSYNTNTKIWG